MEVKKRNYFFEQAITSLTLKRFKAKNILLLILHYNVIQFITTYQQYKGTLHV